MFVVFIVGISRDEKCEEKDRRESEYAAEQSHRGSEVDGKV